MYKGESKQQPLLVCGSSSNVKYHMNTTPYDHTLRRSYFANIHHVKKSLTHQIMLVNYIRNIDREWEIVIVCVCGGSQSRETEDSIMPWY